jgi:hypothetical protein
MDMLNSRVLFPFSTISLLFEVIALEFDRLVPAKLCQADWRAKFATKPDPVIDQRIVNDFGRGHSGVQFLSLTDKNPPRLSP